MPARSTACADRRGRPVSAPTCQLKRAAVGLADRGAGGGDDDGVGHAGLRFGRAGARLHHTGGAPPRAARPSRVFRRGCVAARRGCRGRPESRGVRACRQGTREFLVGEGGTGAQGDERLGRLAAVVVRDPDDDALVDGGVLVDRLLDRLRIDVVAARDDHVLVALDDVEIAVLVHGADVAGHEEAVDEGGRRVLRALPVAGEHVRPLDPDLPRLAGRQQARRIVEGDDVHDDARQRQPDRAGLWRSGARQVGAGRGGFRHAPAAAEALSGDALEALRDLDRERCAAGAAIAQCERSCASMPGWLARAIHIVGTPGNDVARLTSMS